MSENKIPKIIHYVWLGGKPIPERDQKYINQWKEMHPDYEFKLWNEQNFDMNCCEYVSEAFKNKKYSFISDYIRTYALYTEGGIYIDTDVELLKTFDNLLKYDFFTSFENMVMLNPAIMGATKENLLLKDLLDHFSKKHYYENKKKTKPDTFIMPIVASVIFKLKYNLKLDGSSQELNVNGMNCAFLSADYYHAQDYVSGQVKITENTHGIHRYSGSWLTSSQKSQDKLVVKIRNFFGDKIFRKIMKKFLNSKIKKYTKIYKKQEKLKYN